MKIGSLLPCHCTWDEVKEDTCYIDSYSLPSEGTNKITIQVDVL